MRFIKSKLHSSEKSANSLRRPVYPTEDGRDGGGLQGGVVPAVAMAEQGRWREGETAREEIKGGAEGLRGKYSQKERSKTLPIGECAADKTVNS